MFTLRSQFTLAAAVVVATFALAADPPSPKAFFGHDVCEDYWLANYTQLTDYWRALDKASDRLTLVSIGQTAEGREQYMAIISDPANLRHLKDHQRTSRRFAMARDIATETDAANLAKKAKAVVWIDGGLHATETLGAQQLLQTAYDLVSRNDPENRRILKDCVVLLAHANPDGMELVSNWYMRSEDPLKRALNVPRLYQKYIGHDNNRDFYASNMPETQNMNRVLYKEWSPQILYNHHQSAPQGTIMFIPPFRNPFNYHVDPIVQISTDVVGMHMHQRLISAGLGGTIMRSGAPYSTWWNGGLRTTAYFHNMIGILTETFGSPTPTTIPFSAARQTPIADMPLPVPPGPWRLRQSLEYEVGANYAILDYASRYRERLLVDQWRMASRAIASGMKDTWTHYPSRLAEAGAAALTAPEFRDAKAYVLPLDQRDPGSLRWFIDRLTLCGVEVTQMRGPNRIGDREYPAGSYVIHCAQPFRAHVLDMFERQDHPNDFAYPGGPPVQPYDVAGYTLAYQMGIEFTRLLESPPPMQAMPIMGSEIRPAGELQGGEKLDDLDTYRKINATLASGKQVSILTGSAHVGPPGPSSGLAPIDLRRAPRVGLWDRYGGSMTSGWTRWLLERFGFGYQLLFPPDLQGDLNARFDVILLPDGAIPATGRDANEREIDATLPPEWRAKVGAMGSSQYDALSKFVENGGHLVAIGSSASGLIQRFKLPFSNALAEKKPDGSETPLPNSKFFIPGSVLSVHGTRSQLTMGALDAASNLDVIFDESPAWRATESAASSVLATYGEKPLRSGWAWGQEALRDAVALADMPKGRGRIVLCGPELLFRGQPSQSMKIVWNAILRSASDMKSGALAR